MACACRGKNKTKYQWTSADGTRVMLYDDKVVAQARQRLHGGTVVEIKP